MISKYPILSGVTVAFGNTGGPGAVSYVGSGRIIVKSGYTGNLNAAIVHECWHIIDYRDNGQMDWGENLPPANY
jgi:hypothetical protein